MSQNVPESDRDKKRRDVLRLLSQGELTDTEIAEECEVDRRTIYRWRQEPEFATELAERVAEQGELSRRYAIARRERRIKRLEDRLAALELIVEERKAAHGALTGGHSGYIAVEPKKYGEVLRFDAALAREIREIEKQAAIETGQWTEKRELTGKDGTPLMPVSFIEVAGDEIAPEPGEADRGPAADPSPQP